MALLRWLPKLCRQLRHQQPLRTRSSWLSARRVSTWTTCPHKLRQNYPPDKFLRRCKASRIPLIPSKVSSTAVSNCPKTFQVTFSHFCRMKGEDYFQRQSLNFAFVFSAQHQYPELRLRAPISLRTSFVNKKKSFSAPRLQGFSDPLRRNLPDPRDLPNQRLLKVCGEILIVEDVRRF